jgi:hypothetical protein
MSNPARPEERQRSADTRATPVGPEVGEVGYSCHLERESPRTSRKVSTGQEARLSQRSASFNRGTFRRRGLGGRSAQGDMRDGDSERGPAAGWGWPHLSPRQPGNIALFGACRARHCAGTTTRRPSALHTMPMPGNPRGGSLQCICSSHEAGRRRPISTAQSSTFPAGVRAGRATLLGSLRPGGDSEGRRSKTPSAADRPRPRYRRIPTAGWCDDPAVRARAKRAKGTAPQTR